MSLLRYWTENFQIWRCNILWHNKLVLILLLTLYVTTAGKPLRSASILFINLKEYFHKVFSIWTNVTIDRIIVLTGFIAALATAMTTASATFFIVLKIVLVTRKSRMHHSYTQIIVIIVESGALVSVLMLAAAFLQLISFVHPLDLESTSGKILFQVGEYVSALKTSIIVRCVGGFLIFINILINYQGIGPTLIAFRVSEETPRTEVDPTSRSRTLSRLTFRRTTRGTTSNSQARDSHVSIIRSMSAHEEGNLQGRVGMKAQMNNHCKQEEHINLERITYPIGLESV